ncbi:adenosylmethionine--8-amino-7-oxononanoate transaminase [Thermosulfuriphilus sp.]
MSEYTKGKILALDRRHLWHPFTQMKDYEDREPPIIVEAEGLRLKTIDGQILYDTISSWWVNTHGHRHPALNQALVEQIERLDHVNFSGFTHREAVEVVDRLRSFLPEELSRFFYSDNGSTAVEVALKMAFQFWQNQGYKEKTRFIFLENAYHGDTLGAVSVGGIDLFHRLYRPLTFFSYKTRAPYCYRCPDRKDKGLTQDAPLPACDLSCLAALEDLLREKASEICAIIVEPRLLAAGGMIVYPREYLQGLVRLARSYEILVIFDEVATGFGRTGTMFAMEQAGVVPDIICLAKGLTGGYLPLSLTVATDRIFEAFYDDYLAGKTFFHGHSYTANPLACAVAIANLKLFAKERPLEKGKETREHFHRRLLELFAGEPYVGDIRYLGYVGAIELVADKGSKKNFPTELRLGFQIYMESLKEGLVLRPLGDVIYWLLPLCLTASEAEEILEKSREVIRRIIHGLGGI